MTCQLAKSGFDSFINGRIPKVPEAGNTAMVSSTIDSVAQGASQGLGGFIS